MSETSTETAAETTDGAKDHDFVIIVNAEAHTVEAEAVSYEQVVHFAYPTPPAPDARYTVTYRKAKAPNHEGSLAAGQSVEVKKEGTIFNVKTTGKS